MSTNVRLYAGSVRPGGGLTVVRILAERILSESSATLQIVTGSRDSELDIRHHFANEPRVAVLCLFAGVPSSVRGLLGKAHCWIWSLTNHKRKFVFTINFWMPARCQSITYHINLLSFLDKPGDSIGNRLRNLDARLACRFASTNLFESAYLMQRATSRTDGNVRDPRLMYIGLAADFTEFGPEGNMHPDEGRLLMVSSPQPHKDNTTVLKALSILIEKHNVTHWYLDVYGGQNTAQWLTLERAAEKSGLGDRLRIHGPVSKTELVKAYRNAVALMSASRVESFAMVPLEAMACGCPTITTNETSMPESLGNASCLVSAGDADAFSDAAARLANDAKFRSQIIERGFEQSARFSESRLQGILSSILRPSGSSTCQSALDP